MIQPGFELRAASGRQQHGNRELHRTAIGGKGIGPGVRLLSFDLILSPWRYCGV
jgi:hypothetical protein